MPRLSVHLLSVQNILAWAWQSLTYIPTTDLQILRSHCILSNVSRDRRSKTWHSQMCDPNQGILVFDSSLVFSGFFAILSNHNFALYIFPMHMHIDIFRCQDNMKFQKMPPVRAVFLPAPCALGKFVYKWEFIISPRYSLTIRQQVHVENCGHTTRPNVPWIVTPLSYIYRGSNL